MLTREGAFLSEESQEVFDVDDADDVVEIALINRIAGVLLLTQQSGNRFRIGVQWNTGDMHARHHNLAGIQFTERKELTEYFA